MTSRINPEEHVAHNRHELRETLKQARHLSSSRIGDLLVEDGVITREQLRDVLAQQQVGHHEKLGRMLINRGWVTEEQMNRVMARRLNLPFVRLGEFDFEPRAMQLVDPDFARAHGVMPLMVHGQDLVVALENVADPELIDLLHFISGRSIVVVAASPSDIDYAISVAYEPFNDAGLVREVEHVTRRETPDQEEATIARQQPVVKLVRNLIVDAIRRRASDIHIRPRERDAEVIFRIDGSLIPVRTFSKSVLPAIVSRIKILGSMDISEHRLPQDGQTRMHNRGRVIDLRLSVIPAIHGESVVIRILDVSQGLKGLNEIGFSAEDEERFRNLMHYNQGLILVTGPTGSGKSTTLYAALQEVRERDVNIITVEDPVEYHLDGVNQIQVAPQIGYTFARALRHILRHDPDVIMVGEIRDGETAKMAVESALTGHLVLSTLHTNSAATSITRLLEIGVDAYLTRATVTAVLAQRLVRLNCPNCVREEVVALSVREELGLGEDEVFHYGPGCDQCFGTGFRGRHAVYELLRVTPALREQIHPGADATELEQQARADGMVSLTDNALALARQGRTSIAEVYRVRLI